MLADAGGVHQYVFACQDFTGVTSFIPLGIYEVTVNLLNAQEQLVARSGSQFIHVWGESEPTFEGLIFEFPTDRATTRLSWGVECDSTDSVEILIDGELALTTSCWFTIEYPWVDILATLGSHDLTASVLATDGEVLVTSATNNLNLAFGNQLLHWVVEF